MGSGGKEDAIYVEMDTRHINKNAGLKALCEIAVRHYPNVISAFSGHRKVLGATPSLSTRPRTPLKEAHQRWGNPRFYSTEASGSMLAAGKTDWYDYEDLKEVDNN